MKNISNMMWKQEIILFLYRAPNCPTEAEKIDLNIYLWTLEDKNKTKYNRISFLYYNS